MPEKTPAGIVLAAGKGTRMKSDLPKALHLLAELPMVEWVGKAMREAGIERVIVVIGHRGELVEEALGDRYEYAWQKEQLGTGHAVQMTLDALGDFDGPVLIAPGDGPLLTGDVFRTLLARHDDHACTFATSVVSDPFGYGRVVRGSSGTPLGIIEQKDANQEQRAIREVSAALYVFDGRLLREHLPQLKNQNAQGEYYLPDLVGILASKGLRVEAVQFEDPNLLAGVNDRWQLAEAEKELRRRLLKQHALAGVTLRDPDSTFIGPSVEIGVDTVIEAGSSLLGQTRIGASCRIGPYSRIKDSRLGDNVSVIMSQVNEAEIGSGAKCGPYANIRPGANLGDDVKIGNFVEVKNSRLGDRVSASHLAYLGDSEIGDDTNIGAGAITCNYDGFVKSRTTVGKRAFIGSNATIVAPIEIGDDALVAAGSTITEGVPGEAGAFGRARQETKPGWAVRWRERKKSQR